MAIDNRIWEDEQKIVVNLEGLTAVDVPNREEAEVNTAYHEIPGSGHKVDVLLQLKTNIDQLEDLQGQLKFMIREIGSFVKAI